MKTDDFINTATDSTAWLKKAKALRRSADSLWDLFTEELKNAYKSGTDELDLDYLEYATDVLRNSQLLYSLCAECVLKGLLIKNDPSSISITTVIDGNREFVSAEFRKIGKIQIDTHNLEKLAEAAGVLKNNEKTDTRELLAFSTQCIQWVGRYPVPLDSESVFKERGVLPQQAFIHYYRDFMDPFLDKLFAVYEC